MIENKLFISYKKDRGKKMKKSDYLFSFFLNTFDINTFYIDRAINYMITTSIYKLLLSQHQYSD